MTILITIFINIPTHFLPFHSFHLVLLQNLLIYPLLNLNIKQVLNQAISPIIRTIEFKNVHWLFYSL